VLDDGTTLYHAADLYDLDYQAIRGDLGFYADVCARARPARVLELGCGTGRLLLALARQGVQITGLDLEPAMLERLEAGLRLAEPELRGRVELVSGDMRRYRGEGAVFGAVLVAYNTLQHLDEAGLEATLTGTRHHLVPGGLLALDLFAPITESAVSNDAGFQGAEQLPSADPERRIRSAQRSRYDARTRILRTTYRYWRLDAAGREHEVKELELSRRQWRLAELELALAAAGFEIGERYGDLDLSPLLPESPRIMLVAKAERR